MDIDLPESLPGVDMASALKRLNGNRKLYWQLLLDFAKRYASVTEEIRTLINNGDLNGAERMAHTVKGAGGNLSADGIYNAARRLEYQITRKGGNYDPLLSELNQMVTPLLAELETILEQEQSRDGQRESLIDPAQLAPAMVELAGFLQANDANALTSMESLKELMVNSLFREAIVELENHIENFDFISAYSALQKIADDLKISL